MIKFQMGYLICKTIPPIKSSTDAKAVPYLYSPPIHFKICALFFLFFFRER